MREVMRAYQETTSAIVGRYDGHVAKYLGDGVLAYFGYPQAHEDDSERAVRAGLDIVHAVGELHPGEDIALQTRVGIATGLVVVGDLTGEGVSEQAAVAGETPNLAARLQELAEPGNVVICGSTYRLTGSIFECRDLEPQELKGFAETVRTWNVIRPRRAESRFDAVRAAKLTQLVGREEETEILLRRWQRAKSNDGQVVLISGEPGIGKSRLAHALQVRIADDPHLPLRFQCSPYHTNSAFYPLIENIERIAGFELGNGAETKLEKTRGMGRFGVENILS